MQLVVVKARMRHGDSRNTGMRTIMVKPLTEPHSGQCIANSSKICLVTSAGQPIRRPYIYLQFYRGKLPTSWCTNTLLGRVRVDMETTSWQSPTSFNAEPGASWVVTHYQDYSSHQADDPLGTCWVTRGLHRKGGSLCIHQWSEGPRSETASPHKWWEVSQWTP
jgi:hypothetical protein